MSYAGDALTRLTGLSLDPERSVPISPPPTSAPSSSAPPTNSRSAPAADEPAADVAGDGDAEGQDEESHVQLRALVNTKEAGALIGKAGKNVAEIREITGVKAGVSKVVEGVPERILTVSGGLSQVSKAFNLFAKHLVETQNRTPTSPTTSERPIVTIRLLVPHQQVGSVIGKGGARIREIQEVSGARIVAGKEMLSQSTERILEIHGLPDSIQSAIAEVSESLIQDNARSAGTIFYKPEVSGSSGISTTRTTTSSLESRKRSDAGVPTTKSTNGGSGTDATRRREGATTRPAGDREPRQPRKESGDLQTATLSVPSDLVGCIIGRGGSIINDIRADSGSRISIAKESDPSTGKRTFTIHGAAENNQKALQLIYETLENEKERRARDDGRDEE